MVPRHERDCSSLIGGGCAHNRALLERGADPRRGGASGQFQHRTWICPEVSVLQSRPQRSKAEGSGRPQALKRALSQASRLHCQWLRVRGVPGLSGPRTQRGRRLSPVALLRGLPTPAAVVGAAAPHGPLTGQAALAARGAPVLREGQAAPGHPPAVRTPTGPPLAASRPALEEGGAPPKAFPHSPRA